MKKIPTLFERTFEGHRISGITENVTPGMEWVLQGEGIATVKYDGSCCAIIDGVFYKRYDAKAGKPVPPNAIKCQDEADPITGHLPCWVPCERDNKADKWFWEAFDSSIDPLTPDWTYEAIGPHFQGNPHHVESDILVPHGNMLADVKRTFEGIRTFLESHDIEGIVFWKDGEPRCKIKRTDFGYKWG